MTTLNIEAELAALYEFSGSQLRERWIRLTGRTVPHVSLALLRLALAWELQAHHYGGLSPQAQRRLQLFATSSGQEPRQRLVREWKGSVHTVIIEADETIRWNGKTWRSLSEVARAITGTRWSGPAFFGLKQKRKAA